MIKACSPFPCSLAHRTAGSSQTEKLRDLGMERGQRSSEMHLGVRPCKGLKNKEKNLELDTVCDWCQVPASAAVMPSHFLVPVISLAAVFCASCG